MIDFAKITKTLDGMDCRYIHERESNGERIHVFALFNDVGERYEYYNQQGKRLKWSSSKWELEQDSKWQIYEPKIVEVTRWVALYEKLHAPGEYFIEVSKDEDGFPNTQLLLGSQQHTFRFEVPNE